MDFIQYGDEATGKTIWIPDQEYIEWLRSMVQVQAPTESAPTEQDD